MAVETSVNRWSFTGNGVWDEAAITGLLFDETHLVVIQTTTAGVVSTLVLNTDYTVTNNYPAAGATVVFAAPFTSGYTLTVLRVVDLEQNTSFRNLGAFFPELHEDALDKLTMIDQQQEDELDRSLKLPDTEAGTPTKTTLPSATSRASKFLGFDASGNPIAAAGTSADLGPVSAFINTLLDDVDAAAARTTLGAIGTGEAIAATIFDAKGDLVSASAGDTAARLAVGSDGDILTPNSGATAGLAWLRQPQAVAMVNGRLAWSVAASALTVALKGIDGNNPSATNPVFVIFRNATLTGEDYVVRKVTAALSVVVSSGSTLGCVNSQPFKVWVAAIDNAGTVELAVFQSLSSTLTISSLADDSIISTTAEGGAGGADTAGVLYSTSARSNVAMRVLGYGEWGSGLGTVGTWGTAPTQAQLYAAGMALPGQVISSSSASDGAVATTTTTMPADDTIPQNTEGAEFMTVAHVRKRASNVLHIHSVMTVGLSATLTVVMALFQDSTANALAAVMLTKSANDPETLGPLVFRMPAAAAGSTTFKVRAGPATAGTLTFNGEAAGRLLGGVISSRIDVTEIAT